MKPLPPVAVLKALYTYDPATGEVRHRHKRGGSNPGDLAGSLCPRKGYRSCQVTHEGTTFRVYVHRLAYALHHGVDPYPLMVDHINRERSDNRAANLRLVDAKGNRANSVTVNRRPVQIAYPDGRGRLTTDSVATASRILGLDVRRVRKILARDDNQLYYSHPYLTSTWVPTGIRISYAP
jgi:hypothetical protein